jgi:hypothetical protein
MDLAVSYVWLFSLWGVLSVELRKHINKELNYCNYYYVVLKHQEPRTPYSSTAYANIML